ncbi:hypothetical protein SAMN04490356_1242 [Streptomyces melanosporofaciens]|uniref:Uncharacterized protein n=1 Tax=Streptomyces melanosporofaciens TaxID=67327 RepID=A0A1H4LB68_STRMJ|nr:hypothetical protein SAMN04490356_1242 [Streptomyces melanosporofaciens]
MRGPERAGAGERRSASARRGSVRKDAQTPRGLRLSGAACAGGYFLSLATWLVSSGRRSESVINLRKPTGIHAF